MGFMRRMMVSYIVTGAVAALMFGGCHTHGPAGETATAPVAMRAAVATAAREDVSVQLVYMARVQGLQDVEVRAQVSGILLKRLFVDGQAVHKGQALFQIDPQPLKVAEREAAARLAAARTQLDLATRARDRIDSLFTQRGVSQKQNEEAQAAFAAARGDVLTSEARLHQVQLDLQHTVVAAPIAGLVGAEVRSEGNLVTAGTESSLLTHIVQADSVYVDFSIPEQEARFIRAHLPAARGIAALWVTVLFDDGAQYPVRCRLIFLDNRVAVGSATVKARAVVSNAHLQLIPGEIVDARLEGLVLENVIVVPRTAIVAAGEGATIWVLDTGDRARPRRVSLSRNLGDRVIVEGLDPGDRFVTDAAVAIQPGTPIVPQGAGGAQS